MIEEAWQGYNLIAFLPVGRTSARAFEKRVGARRLLWSAVLSGMGRSTIGRASVWPSAAVWRDLTSLPARVSCDAGWVSAAAYSMIRPQAGPDVPMKG